MERQITIKYNPHWLSSALIIVLLGAIAFLGYDHYRSTDIIAHLNQTIAQLHSRVDILTHQISTTQNALAGTRASLTTSEGQRNAIQAQVAAFGNCLNASKAVLKTNPDSVIPAALESYVSSTEDLVFLRALAMFEGENECVSQIGLPAWTSDDARDILTASGP